MPTDSYLGQPREDVVGRLAKRPYKDGDPMPAVGSLCLVSEANCDVESDQHRAYGWRKVIGYSEGNQFVCMQTRDCWPTVERLSNCWFAEIPTPTAPAPQASNQWCSNCDTLLARALAAEKRVRELESPGETTCAGCTKLEKEVEEELENRDRNADYADQLTAMIGVYFETDHGEHSNMNDPWENAIETMRVKIGLSREQVRPSPPKT